MGAPATRFRSVSGMSSRHFEKEDQGGRTESQVICCAAQEALVSSEDLHYSAVIGSKGVLEGLSLGSPSVDNRYKLNTGLVRSLLVIVIHPNHGSPFASSSDAPRSRSVDLFGQRPEIDLHSSQHLACPQAWTGS